MTIDLEALIDAPFIIHKAGRGWYRPNAQGYTNYRYEAGQFTREQAESYTFPNGPDGPRDGLTYEPVTLFVSPAPAMIATIQAQAERVRVLEGLLRRSLSLHSAYSTGYGSLYSRAIADMNAALGDKS